MAVEEETVVVAARLTPHLVAVEEEEREHDDEEVVHLHEDVEVLAPAEARQRRHAHQREAEQQHVPRRPRRRGDHHRRIGQPGVVDVMSDDVDEGPPAAGGRHAR